MKKMLRQLRQALGQGATDTNKPINAEDYDPTSVDLFASDHYQAVNKARLDHLAKMNFSFEQKTVLDVGSGPGDMAQFFVERGAKVVCVDGREDNIQRMKEVYPELEGHVVDVQVPDIMNQFGKFDVVFCYGLLYHVENPLQVIRNMANVCNGTLLLSTIICDSKLPVVQYHPELFTATQALAGMGCRPSEPFIEMSLEFVGFEYIYRPKFKPEHQQFQFSHRNNLDWNRGGVPMRGIFIASHQELDNPNLVRVNE